MIADPARNGDPNASVCRWCSFPKRQVRETKYCNTCDGGALVVALNPRKK